MLLSRQVSHAKFSKEVTHVIVKKVSHAKFSKEVTHVIVKTGKSYKV
jgi:hypothetical protein